MLATTSVTVMDVGGLFCPALRFSDPITFRIINNWTAS